ncbi:MAG: cation:dicarboxylase symporter family transporter [Gemmatimonadetes bacterium]|nr:cation:dicarboxylase symporter family transporter [Gemmatimonadota bacterium]
MWTKLKRVPGYVWTLGSLVAGVVLGGLLPGPLGPVASATTALIKLIVLLVPLLILGALSPAIATLVKRGLAGKFAASVIGWFALTSTAAGLFGLVVSSIIFDVPFSSGSASGWAEARNMLGTFAHQSEASLPLLSIVGAVILGLIAVWIPRLDAVLARVERGIHAAGHRIAYVLIPIILMLGITIGVRFGARMGMGHYLTMTLYTAVLCLTWWAFFVFVIVRLITGRPVGKLITTYYIPTAAFAAGSQSSLATMPVNLANIKRYGVRDEVSDFVIPFGAIFNMNASAMAYVAYAPFVLTHIFGIEISWVVLLTAWPAIVVLTFASPGLPAGMGTALWSSTMFSAMLGLEDPVRATFVTTWMALSSGLPDMFRTATNVTDDGFSAVLFDTVFDRLFAKKTVRQRTGAVAVEAKALPAGPRPEPL